MKSLLFCLILFAVIAVLAMTFYNVDFDAIASALPLAGMSLIGTWEKRHGKLDVQRKRIKVKNDAFLRNPWEIAMAGWAKGLTFKPEWFVGSYQSNDGDKLTYHPVTLVYALFQELGELNIAQMTRNQALAYLGICQTLIDSQDAKYRAVKGRKRPMAYNLTEDRLERGGHWNNARLVYAQWNADDTVEIRHGDDTLYTIASNGQVT